MTVEQLKEIEQELEKISVKFCELPDNFVGILFYEVGTLNPWNVRPIPQLKEKNIHLSLIPVSNIENIKLEETNAYKALLNEIKILKAEKSFLEIKIKNYEDDFNNQSFYIF